MEKNENKTSFSALRADPEIAQRFEKVKRYFFLKESTYDVTNRCNMTCDGCYYYEGDKANVNEISDPTAWNALLKKEKERGITFVVLAGAEPALAPAVLKACYDALPLGCIATNGLARIPQEVGYRLHISVWGNDETSWQTRQAKRVLPRQIENYKDDDRATWVYTFTRKNIQEAEEVVAQLDEVGATATFNLFSAPVGYAGDLHHTPESLRETRRTMLDLLARYPKTVLFSPYSAVAHTHAFGLHTLFGCSYPRRNASSALGLGRSFRQYRADLTWDRQSACCVPDTDCDDCRHYAAGSAVVTARMYRHADSPEAFKAWLDYVDTYLAVWVRGYEKGPNLQPQAIAPPGHGLFDAQDLSR